MRHFSVTINFINNGEWAYPTGHVIDEYIGFFAVSIFFMISAYLFWGRCSNDGTNWIKVLIGRLFRIGPMFIVSSLMCWAVAYKFGLNKSFDTLAVKDVFHWFDLGLTNTKPDVFGFKYSYLINSGVMWTLPWEWMLYLSLPFFSLVANKKNSVSVVLAVLFIDFYFFKNIDKLSASLVAMFVMGALSYEIKKIVRFNFNEKVLSLASVLLFIVCAFVFKNGGQISLESSLLYACFFLTICLGANPLGLLRINGAVRLGEISFSLYLIHGIVWYVFGRVMLKFDMAGHEFIYYFLASLAFLFSCFLSAFTYHFIEAKMISIGRKIQSAIF